MRNQPFSPPRTDGPENFHEPHAHAAMPARSRRFAHSILVAAIEIGAQIVLILGWLGLLHWLIDNDLHTAGLAVLVVPTAIVAAAALDGITHRVCRAGRRAPK